MFICPRCQTPNPPDKRFCSTCGYALTPAPPPAPAPPGASAPPGTAVLLARFPGGHVERHPLARPFMHLGRGPDNDIVVNFPTVSTRHLRLETAAGRLQVMDLGSLNGTQVNGRFLAPNTPSPLQPGDVLRIGDLQGNSVSLVLEGDAPGAAPPMRTRRLGTHMLAQHPQLIIGRDPSCHLRLEHPTVSRQHAEIVQQGGGYAARDLGSGNGTYVNGRRITGWVTLNPGDVIQIGPFKLVYDGRLQGLATSMSRGHRLDVVGLGMQVANGKMILNDISLTVQAGEFISLVGGSGAGKSTLMKAMNGYNPATHGQMLIDGEPLYPNLAAYRAIMGYVPQDDIIHRDLPVYQALWYAARLRLPDAGPAEIQQRITEALDLVDMKDHAQKPVKVLSGGQRKRVSIAVELLAQPDLLFLDEPTSGLDPGLEKKMMYDLNRLADRGKTVILVTHATSNIEQCDHVAFLAQGELAYYGPPRDATPFFQARDFADIYLQLGQEVDPSQQKPPPPVLQPYYQPGAGKVSAGKLWAQHYRRSPQRQQYVAARQQHVNGRAAAPATSRPSAPRDSSLRQIFILIRRQLDLIRHNPATLFILLLMMPIIAALFMAVSNEGDLVGKYATAVAADAALTAELVGEDVGAKANYTPAATAQQLVTMLGLALTQAGTFGAAYEIVKERAIFKRERAVNLRVGAYVAAKLAVLGLFAIVQVVSALLILSIKVDLGFAPVFDFFPSGAWELFVTLLLAVLASITFGLFISAVVPGSDVVMYIILVQLFTQIILSGALFPLPDSAVGDLVSKAVISHWTMDAMGSSVGMVELDNTSRACAVVEIPNEAGGMTREVRCEGAAIGDLSLDYLHDPEHLRNTWIALLVQMLVWGSLTTLVQARRKTE